MFARAPGLIRDLKTEEISRSRLLDRLHRIILVRHAAIPATIVVNDISHDDDDITLTALAVRHLSRTASHEHRVIAGLAVYKHRVEGVADRRKRDAAPGSASGGP